MPPYYRPPNYDFLKNNFLSWRIGAVGSSVRDMEVFNDELYVASNSSQIYVLNDIFQVVRTINLPGNNCEKLVVNDDCIFVATSGPGKIFRSFDGVNFVDVYTHGANPRAGAGNNDTIMFTAAGTSNNFIYTQDNGDNWTTATLDANNSLYWNSCKYIQETGLFFVARGNAGYKVGRNVSEIFSNPIITPPIIYPGDQFKTFSYDGERYYAGSVLGEVFNTTDPYSATSWVENPSFIRAPLQSEIEDLIQYGDIVYGIDSLGNVFKIIDNNVEILPHASFSQPLSIIVFNDEIIYADLSAGYLHKTLKGND